MTARDLIKALLDEDLDCKVKIKTEDSTTDVEDVSHSFPDRFITLETDKELFTQEEVDKAVEEARTESEE